MKKIILLLIIVALLVLGFLFLKNQLSNRLGSIIPKSSLAGLVGNKITSKEAGIAACKKSGIDDCFSLVAVSFSDLSVCSQAKDKKACETNAQEMIQSKADSGNGGGTNTNTGTEDQYAELKTCKQGTYYATLQGKLAITGKENVTLGGTSYSVCCYEASDTKFSDENLQAIKTCLFIDQPESGVITYDKVGGKYILKGATLLKDGNQCLYTEDEETNKVTEECMSIPKSN